ncbi:hypothetical protein [Streptomyces spiralis]|nr:hypothetical protein [Streptomyces spiralis]
MPADQTAHGDDRVGEVEEGVDDGGTPLLGGVSSIMPGSRWLAPHLAALSSVADAPHRRTTSLKTIEPAGSPSAAAPEDR